MNFMNTVWTQIIYATCTIFYKNHGFEFEKDVKLHIVQRNIKMLNIFYECNFILCTNRLYYSHNSYKKRSFESEKRIICCSKKCKKVKCAL